MRLLIRSLRAADGWTLIAASSAVVSAWSGWVAPETRLINPPPSAPPNERTPPAPIPIGKRMPRAISFPLLRFGSLTRQYTTIDERVGVLVLELDKFAFRVDRLAVPIDPVLKNAIPDFRHGFSFPSQTPVP